MTRTVRDGHDELILRGEQTDEPEALYAFQHDNPILDAIILDLDEECGECGGSGKGTASLSFRFVGEPGSGSVTAGCPSCEGTGRIPIQFVIDADRWEAFVDDVGYQLECVMCRSESPDDEYAESVARTIAAALIPSGLEVVDSTEHADDSAEEPK